MRKATVLAVIVAVVAGCGPGDSESTVLVSAAASLTDAFGEMEIAFEVANPDIDVVLNLGGSSSLREQILEGAPADVFAPADMSNMNQIISTGAATRSSVFATNTLAIAVPAGNPAGVTGLSDLTRTENLVGLCAPQVPCGDLARQVFDRAGLVPEPDTDEPDVKALLTKIQLGELDAGVVYSTDVASTASVEGIEIPAEVNVVTQYPLAVLSSSPNPEGAEAFVGFVLSERGQEIMRNYGFESP